MESIAASNESQNVCQVSGSPENVGSVSLGRRVVFCLWTLTAGDVPLSVVVTEVVVVVPVAVVEELAILGCVSELVLRVSE